MSFRNGVMRACKFTGKCFTFPFVKHQATYNIVIAIVTALTLVWAAMTYHLLDQRERARTELFEIKERIKNSESTTVKIETSFYKVSKSKKSKDNSGYYLYPVVTIKNVGKEKILLKLDNNSLTIKKVKLSGDKIMAEETYNPSYYETVSSSVDESSKRLKLIEVPVDGERSIPYAVKVKNSGVYYITFSARPYFEEGKREVDEHELVWFSAEYKNVQ